MQRLVSFSFVDFRREHLPRDPKSLTKQSKNDPKKNSWKELGGREGEQRNPKPLTRLSKKKNRQKLNKQKKWQQKNPQPFTKQTKNKKKT